MREFEVEGFVREYLEDCLSLGSKFRKPPQVSLELISRSPQGKQEVGAIDVVATTAVQCYAAGIAPMRPRPEEKFLAIADSTLEAGHHTTRMHTHYTWRLVGITRSAIHDNFHGNPFYNSEQQSQRYTEATMGNFLERTDLSSEQTDLYANAANYANEQYGVLLEALRPEIDKRMHDMYPKAGWGVLKTRERLDNKTKKLCQELARYVLPIGQFSTMYHTLSELQLVRLFRASQFGNFSDETRFILASMINSVAAHDPSFMHDLRKPLDKPSVAYLETDDNYISEQKREFDARLGGEISLMHSLLGDARLNLANSVRNVIGVPASIMSDSEAISILMDPLKNPLLADVYETGMLDPLTSCLRQIYFSFDSRISHSADSQRQRHRRTAGATPSISFLYDGSPDYVTPKVLRENRQLMNLYEGILNTIYNNVDLAIKSGIPRETALLLLPNAHTVRVIETGDGFDWLHRWKQRLCYLAQEEIFYSSLSQVEQAGQVFPEAKHMLLAPCGLHQRAGITPRCPEGERFCGKAVFRMSLSEYGEGRLV